MINLNKTQTSIPQIIDLNSAQINLGSWPIPEENNSYKELLIESKTVTDTLKPKLPINKKPNNHSKYKKINSSNNKIDLYGDLKKIHSITNSRDILITSWRNFSNIEKVDIDLNQINQAMDHISIDIETDKDNL